MTATEDRRAGVDHDVVFDDRMARVILAQGAGLGIDLEPARAPSVTA